MPQWSNIFSETGAVVSQNMQCWLTNSLPSIQKEFTIFQIPHLSFFHLGQHGKRVGQRIAETRKMLIFWDILVVMRIIKLLIILLPKLCSYTLGANPCSLLIAYPMKLLLRYLIIL